MAAIKFLNITKVKLYLVLCEPRKNMFYLLFVEKAMQSMLLQFVVV